MKYKLLLAILLLTPAGRLWAQAAQPDAPAANTMPSPGDLLNIVDKATTDAQTGQTAEWSTPIRLVLMFTLLALLPSILAMTTSFS